MKRSVRAVVGLALIAFGLANVLPPQDVTLYALDVGQGDAILIQDRYDQMLVDGGPDDSVLAGLGNAMPLFDRTIETLVLTHPHLDHFMGLIPILERYRVRTVILADETGSTDMYERFHRALAASGSEVKEARDGDMFNVGQRTKVLVLWPPEQADLRAKTLASKDQNAKSVVLRLEASGQAALLMGDATAETETALLGRPDASRVLPATLLKVAHHGSRYSSTAAFLDMIHPREAIISVGKRNDYGHPGWATLRRLESIGANIWRTDEQGAIRAKLKTDGIHVSTER